MAQYFGQTQMSKASNALDYLKKKEQEKKKINLFDFSDVKPKQSIQTPQMNFGQPVSQRNGTNFADYQSSLPKQQPTTQKSSGFSLFPTANAMEENNIPQYNPNKGRGATNLFINERQALENMVNSGIDEEQALKAITEKRKELWGNTQLSQQESNALIQMAKADVDINQAIKAVKEKRYDDATILQKIGKNVLDLAAAGPALMAEQIANVGSFIFNDNELKQQAEAIRKIRKEDFESTIGGKTGSFITGLGETLAVGPTKLAPTLLGRTAQGAMVGGVVGGATPVLEQGKDATMGDIATGGVVGGTIGAVATPLLEKVAIPAVAGTISKGQKYGNALLKGGTQGLSKSVSRDVTKLGQSLKKGTTIPVTNTTTRTIPTKIVERDLGFTPTERDAIIKITKKTPAQYVLEKNLAGKSKTELAEIFEKQSSDMYNGIGEKLKTIDKKVKSNYATDALNDMLEQLTSKPKYARAYSKDIEAIQGMLQRGEYTLDELNNIRRAYDKVNTGIYTAKGEVRSGLDSEIDAKIRRGINETLQKEAQKYGIDVKGMNEELRAGIQMKDALLRRLSQEERNDFIGLQDLGVSAILSGGNPITAVATIGAKKYGEQLAPGLAQKLYNLNKQNVPSRMTRGNTIVTNNKSSNLNLAPSTMSNMAKQEGLKPSILSPKEKKLLKPNQPTNVSNKPLQKTSKTGREVLKPDNKPVIKTDTLEKAKIINKEETKILNKDTSVLPKEIDILEEVKKYKSFEDFKKEMLKPLKKQDRQYKWIGKNKKSEFYTYPEYLQGKVKIKDILNSSDNWGDIEKQTNILKQIYEQSQKPKFLKKILPSNFKEKAQDFVEGVADKVGARQKLLGGEGAKQVPTTLEKAKNWEKSGKSADEIWKETGWERGTDGKWRFEIDDSNAKVLKTSKELDDWQTRIGIGKTLPEVLEHPTIYKQYPEIKDLRVKVDFDGNGGGSFDEASGVITVNGLSKGLPISQERIKSTLLHEIQHYIQSKEGFAIGGRPSKYINIEGNKQLDDLYSTYRKYGDYLNDIKSGKEVVIDKGKPYQQILTKSDIERMRDKLEFKIDNLEQQLKQEVEKSNFTDYKSLAGETEARNVQSRLLKTSEERKLLRPAKTEDVAREKQIVKMEGGKAMSIDKPKLLKPSDKGVIEKIKIPKYIREESKNSSFLIKKEFNPKEIYRGVGGSGEGVGTARYGQGLYTTSNKSLAKQFAGKDGKLLEMDKYKDIPSKPAWFATHMDFNNFIQYDLAKKMGLKSYRQVEDMYDDLSDLFLDLGFDGIVIGKGKDNEIVKFSKNINK